jgi:hypothetical protein
MQTWPSATDSDDVDESDGTAYHVLDVYLVDNRPVELRLDGESLFPVWFKLEFKETGEVSAKVKGVRLATRLGDVINIHQGLPEAQEETQDR